MFVDVFFALDIVLNFNMGRLGVPVRLRRTSWAVTW